MASTPEHLAHLARLGTQLVSRANAAQAHQGEGRGLMLAHVAAVADDVAAEIANLRAVERQAHLARQTKHQRSPR